MAGIGAGFGQADITGNYNRAQANSRANRQQEAKEKQQKIIVAEQAKQQSIEAGGNPIEQQAEQIAGLQQEVKTAKNQAVGKDINGILSKAMTVGTTQATKDALIELESQPESMARFGLDKGDVTVTGQDNRDQVIAYAINDLGMDATNMTQGEIEQIGNDLIGTGQFVMYKGNVLDFNTIGKMTGAMKGKSQAQTERSENVNQYIKATVNGQSPANETAVDFAKRTIDKSELDTEVDQVKSAINADSATTPTASKTPDNLSVDEPPTVDYEQKIVMEDKEDGTSAGSGVIKEEDGTKVDVKVTKDKNGVSKLSTSNGSSATVQKDGAGTVKDADGSVTTIGSNGQSITVKPDGKVVTNDYVLPKSVQMAYDMLGMKSSFSQAASDKRELDAYNAETARIKAKMGKQGTPATLEKMTDFYEGEINPVTKKLNTRPEALKAAEDRMAKDRSARVQRLRDDYNIAKNKDDKMGMKLAQDGLIAENAGKSEVKRQLEIADATNAQEFSDTSTLDNSVTAYDGTMGKNGAKIHKAKARRIENSTDFSSKQEADMADFKEKVRNQRKFGRSKAKVDKLMSDGKFKSGIIDSTLSSLSTILPKEVVDSVGIEDWYSTAIATKGLDRALVDYVRQISGLTVTDAEYSRLQKILGDSNMSEEARLDALDDFYIDLTDDLYAQADSLYTDGYVSSVPKELALMTKPSANRKSGNADSTVAPKTTTTKAPTNTKSMSDRFSEDLE